MLNTMVFFVWISNISLLNYEFLKNGKWAFLLFTESFLKTIFNYLNRFFNHNVYIYIYNIVAFFMFFPFVYKNIWFEISKIIFFSCLLVGFWLKKWTFFEFYFFITIKSKFSYKLYFFIKRLNCAEPDGIFSLNI